MLIKDVELFAFLQKCANRELDGISQVILPARPSSENENTFFTRLTEENEFDLDSYRTVDPAKMLFYLTREQVFPEKYKPGKRIIAGIKACDLEALHVLDTALVNEDFVDPGYHHWRDNSIIITSDCGEIASTCHCNLVEGKPFCEEGFDLNLSHINDHYFVKTGSQKGEAFLQLMMQHVSMQRATDEDQAMVERNRQAVFTQLEEQNKQFARTQDYANLKTDAADLWEEESQKCVGCGGCTNICPTCYCLILNDESEAEKFVKVRSYDSCQYYGYARVAGGGTPRPKMSQRFRNRYLCKFLFMKDNFDLLGCTGCGRCTDTCPAQIDFRKAVYELAGVGERIPDSG